MLYDKLNSPKKFGKISYEEPLFIGVERYFKFVQSINQRTGGGALRGSHDSDWSSIHGLC